MYTQIIKFSDMQIFSENYSYICNTETKRGLRFNEKNFQKKIL